MNKMEEHDIEKMERREGESRKEREEIKYSQLLLFLTKDGMIVADLGFNEKVFEESLPKAAAAMFMVNI
jgi:hypothetical protein